jgi:hypothetical protein
VALPQVLIAPGEDEGGPATEGLTEVMLLARSRFNQGLTQPRNAAMLDILGRPRDSFTTDCAPVTNPRLQEALETREIGPIRVTMVRPALDSLARILARLEADEPEVYAALGTAGALCARLIRGSSTAISNHSWGTAIDLKLEDQLDGFGDGGTQFGLLLLGRALQRGRLVLGRDLFARGLDAFRGERGDPAPLGGRGPALTGSDEPYRSAAAEALRFAEAIPEMVREGERTIGERAAALLRGSRRRSRRRARRRRRARPRAMRSPC